MDTRWSANLATTRRDGKESKSYRVTMPVREIIQHGGTQPVREWKGKSKRPQETSTLFELVAHISATQI